MCYFLFVIVDGIFVGRGINSEALAAVNVGFASPEQYGIAQSDQRSDIYALGVLFNILLTGCHPSDKLAKGKAAKIILKSTQINPEKRFKSVREFEKKL